MRHFSKIMVGVCLMGSSLLGQSIPNTIPVLDMKDYYRRESREDFVQGLAKALHEVGFFAVVNTGVREDLVEGAYEAVEAFFRLDTKTKLKYECLENNRQRGYCPVGRESAKDADRADYKEFFHVGRELSEEQGGRLGYLPNIWPREIGLRRPLMRLFKELEAYMVPLQAAMEAALGTEKRFLDAMTREGDVLLRAIHYPAGDELKGPWAAAHTDIDLFTILPRSTAEGLEVQLSDGSWVAVKVPEGAFVVNGGDMLENLTNGYFRSARHRVSAAGEGDRYSIVLFAHPRDEDRLDPLASCVALTGGQVRYPIATRKELLMERLADMDQASFEMLKELAGSGLVERQIELGKGSLDAMKRLKDAELASPQVLKAIADLDS